jgi:PleD family two-component response regulator
VAEEERAMGQPLGGVQLKVLVAEDNKMSAKILDMLIRKAGHLCTVASDGQQAFDAYSATPFDIIFMVRISCYLLVPLINLRPTQSLTCCFSIRIVG